MMNRMSGRVTDIFGSSGVRAQLSWSAQCGKILNNQKPRNRPVKRTTKTQMGLLTPRVTLAVCEFATRQTTESLEVFRRCFLDDIFRQTWRRWSFVPIKCLEIIAHELFIKTGWALAHNVLIFWPESRRVRRQTLVNQKQFPIDRAKL